MGTLFNRKSLPEPWQGPVTQWLDDLRSKGHRAATVDTRRRHLEYFARQHADCDPWDVTAEGILAWAAEQAWMPQTRHSYYSTFTSFLNWRDRHGGITHKGAFPTVRRPRKPARPVPDDLLRVILRSDDPRVALGARLAASAGLRRSEIAVVHLHDFTEDLLGRSLLVHGKGGSDRFVPLADGLDAAIRDYVRTQGITGYLFPGECSGHIGSAWIGKLINRQLPKPWTLHGLRHRFASTIYRQTHDIIIVQQLLGHESVATTQQYLAFNEAQLRRAVNIADAA